MAVTIPIEIAASKVVGDEKIGPAVAIEIAPGGREAEPVVVLVHAGFGRDIFEPQGRPVGDYTRRRAVAEEKIRRPVARILIGRGILILVLALEVDIAAEIEIQAAIAVEVGGSHPRERTLRRSFKLERVALFRECAIAAIQKKERPRGTQNHRVLASRIVEVGKKGAGRFVQHAQPRAFRNIFGGNVPGSIGANLVQAVWQAARLAHINLIHAIVIDIGDRDSLVPVNVDATRRIEPRPPIRISMKELFTE
jgi:hypothetical protein